MKKRIFIDAGPIAEKNRSGVGHVAYKMVDELASDMSFTKTHDIVLIVAFNKVHLIEKELRDKVSIKRIFIPGRIMNGMVRFNVFPPMDVFIGKGIYLFFNFKNWPLFFSKSITYIHDVYFKVNPDHIEPRNRDLLERNLGRFIERTNLVVAVSEHAKSEIERFYPGAAGKTHVIYNAIDAEIFRPRSGDEQQVVAKKYDLTPKKYFLFLSNIEPRKNILPMLDAYRQFADNVGKDIPLILIGGMGWNNDQIIQKITALNSEGYNVLRPRSYVPDDDLPALLSGAIALVHPAVYEGFGMPILEAIACGTPVIIGNNSSIPEVVGPDFNAYVDVTDAHDIGARMIELYERPAALDSRLKERAALFTWTKAKEKLIGLIEGMEVEA
ncbi:glycosyltransferase family 1 protein [Streptomyces caniscabiei]|uniref:glycosyltransferase family 4 protein n=1 Tax=Streptomyces caniscabiei TaxID=2746961 RepID=UPI0029BF4561|nr:glycosyltransferase family 1 protein [Streptomyces caniscabiei]MDX2776411.1 glycosyltransferase family 1 protein [Streptomyces caniscabiei]